MVDWQPDPQIYMRLRELLTASHLNPNQLSVRHGLEQLVLVPDWNNYLATVFAIDTSANEPDRTLAGLMLKNDITGFIFNSLRPPQEQDSTVLPISDACLAYIKRTCISMLAAPSKQARTTFAMIASAIIVHSASHLDAWPELAYAIPSALESEDINLLDGAITCISVLTEDAISFAKTELLATLDARFALKLMQLFQVPVSQIQSSSIQCIKSMIAAETSVVSQHTALLVQSIFAAVGSMSDQVITLLVCQLLVELIEKDFAAVAATEHFQTVIEFMLHCTMQPQEAIALESCEFWIAAIADHADRNSAISATARQAFRLYLPRLLPALLYRMEYSARELQELERAMATPVAAEYGHFVRPRTHEAAHSGANNADDDDDDDDDDGDDDDDEEFGDKDWTLRKCAASALDLFAHLFSGTLWEQLLPLLYDMLRSPEWKQREVGILALGAVAEGCQGSMQNALPQLVPFLLASLSDQQPLLIRSISCWTLMRYSSWVADNHAGTPENPNIFFEVLQGFLHCVNTTARRLQETACSALAAFEDNAGDLLVPHLEMIISTLVHVLPSYEGRALTILYDVIGSLAEAVGSELNQPHLAEMLMRPLIHRWQTVEPSALEQWSLPLLECLAATCRALQTGFIPFAPMTLQKCVVIIQSGLRVLAEIPTEQFEQDAVIAALDMLSALAEGLDTQFESTLSEGIPFVIQLLPLCHGSFNPDIQLSVFSLIGDFAQTCFGRIQPSAVPLMQMLREGLNPQYPSTCNNAAWAIGELAVKLEADFAPFVPTILPVLINILAQIKSPRSLPETTALAIGRIGLACPDLVAPHLHLFAEKWCTSTRGIKDNMEKDSAFRGMYALVSRNPHAIVPAFAFFCDAIASWDEANIQPDLKLAYSQALLTFKSGFGDGWQQLFAQFPPALRERLALQWGL
ncbi:importin beta-2 [Capsaspora owczarzaki ATCC 30864]|uniref:Importin beta-2 n=1 Tax=Capsaspora owczarzaki (strain ATCC 30864) TaxID=595528 RepID=A0A0D2VSQ3_CAPO3|nr:importin beta-2 [Capsaspora owczarzaki ATCC 30864]KJE94152.1 importin beta-2 [Capsaspora owczarzaki ATCC 30864]|eukprot:XP_004347587.2 importin beta-2 [Capsaspora owczarzaki ATCC 30864]